jgi:hypothetical protein
VCSGENSEFAQGLLREAEFGIEYGSAEPLGKSPMDGEELGLVNYWGSIWKKRWLEIAVTVIAPIVATLIYPPGKPAVGSFIQAEAPAA